MSNPKNGYCLEQIAQPSLFSLLNWVDSFQKAEWQRKVGAMTFFPEREDRAKAIKRKCFPACRRLGVSFSKKKKGISVSIILVECLYEE
ncbi:hypothetical protein Pedsa_0512 [Pseudopedobacter saltans DSM 12145]|uniref:Uncharacterized protein n=1 Tax=Pseudopedobacter saltans (strain ATCC 51119 / DSM 12145 / JCM 21818 / CCUG 39354 / LMG 10337 / NBRC 100064 / NCIMB 13643) TaxID=762903 RepID=F0S6L7_PSESL|nr:hypothetical protein [Pseudopedobacter saltans]ADY51093.1 hypothetical protein Pedsa_0512 [Pseudopedobacter saltans DSM 12145]